MELIFQNITPNTQFDEISSRKLSTEMKIYYFKYKTLSVSHLDELQEDINRLQRAKMLSTNKTYQGYLDKLKFALPDDFPEVKSIIIVAVFDKPMHTNFIYNGIKHQVIVPHGYYIPPMYSEAELRKVILKDVIKEPGFRIERTFQVHMKLLAVRSGLGKYGRNNLCYIEGMGSLLKLIAYYTDFKFKTDNWTDIQMMEQCKNCKGCINSCPNKAIREDSFIVDINRCVTLYNEIEGTFPDWMDKNVHNALFGCMRCQQFCPANKSVINLFEKFENIPEEETTKILHGKPDDDLLELLVSKLRIANDVNSLKQFFPVVSRNLNVLLKPV
ncbi:MAG: 4Fe-4S double cluster binding domain-containing protein [Candidatus Hodarchaeota archaeon]